MQTSLSTTPAFVGQPSIFSKVWFLTKFALLLLFGSVLSFNTAKAQVPGDRFFPQHELVGSFQANLDVPAFGGTITVLTSFSADGILIESDTPTVAPFLGSTVLGNGHGVWKPTGRNTYSFVYLKEIYPPNGGSAIAVGLCRVDGVATASQDRTKLQITNLKFTFTDAGGNVVFTTTGTGAATRIAVE